MTNKRLIGIIIAIMFLLSIPLIAGFPWSLWDFVAAGVLLFGAGFACEVVLRTVKEFRYRVALCAGILFMLFIVWAELAVGLFGTPLAGS